MAKHTFFPHCSAAPLRNSQIQILPHSITALRRNTFCAEIQSEAEKISGQDREVASQKLK
jgi:hypothetical protein